MRLETGTSTEKYIKLNIEMKGICWTKPEEKLEQCRATGLPIQRRIENIRFLDGYK